MTLLSDLFLLCHFFLSLFLLYFSALFDSLVLWSRCLVNTFVFLCILFIDILLSLAATSILFNVFRSRSAVLGPPL